jgi:hypothetical protein
MLSLQEISVCPMKEHRQGEEIADVLKIGPLGTHCPCSMPTPFDGADDVAAHRAALEEIWHGADPA